MISRVKIGIISFVLILFALQRNVFAQTSKIVREGTCGESATWCLDEEGTLIISGTGAIDDRSFEMGLYNTYSYSKVIINEGITYIGDSVFHNSNMVEIQFPSSLVGIGSGAFSRCYGLYGKITLPCKLKRIGSYAFSNCTHITEFVFPDSLEEIDKGAFYDCSSLSTVKLPVNLKKIGDYAFEDCYRSLKSVIIPGNPTIGEGIFNHCDDYIIYGYSGSYADSYAKAHNIQFVDISDEKLSSFRYDISKADISGINISYPYTGKAIKPNPSITLGGYTLRNGKDYSLAYKNNKKEGTAALIVKGKGSYAGSKTINYNIYKLNVKNAYITNVSNQYRYTGKALRPSPLVSLNGRFLVEKTDYAITYKRNKKPGSATIIISGKGKYKGTKKVSFEIVKDVSDNAKKSVKTVLSDFSNYEKVNDKKCKLIVDEIGNVYKELQDGSLAIIEDKLTVCFQPYDITFPKAALTELSKKFSETIWENIRIKPSSYSDCKNDLQLLNKVAKEIQGTNENITFSCNRIQYYVSINTLSVPGAAHMKGTIRTSYGKTYDFQGVALNETDITAEMELLKKLADLKIEEAKKALYEDATGMIIPKQAKQYFTKVKKSTCYNVMKNKKKSLDTYVKKGIVMIDKFSSLKKAALNLNSIDVSKSDEKSVLKKISSYDKKIEEWEKAVKDLSI